MKPLVTLIRESLADRLRQSTIIAGFAGGEKADPTDLFFQGGRVFLNRFEAWDEAEFNAIGVYALREDPIANNLNPSPVERKLTFSVDILTSEDAALEERLDLVASEVETLYTLDSLGEIIKAKGGPDTLLKIEWLSNERGFVPEAERTLGVNLMTFSLEYGLPWEDAELPPFKTAVTDWKAQTPEGEIAAENIVHLDQD